MSRRVVSLPQAWADRLGIDAADGVSVELVAHFEHLGDDRDVLVERQRRERRELAAERVSPRVVGEHLADGRVAEGALDRLSRSTAECAGEPRVEREAAGRSGRRALGLSRSRRHAHR